MRFVLTLFTALMFSLPLQAGPLDALFIPQANSQAPAAAASEGNESARLHDLIERMLDLTILEKREMLEHNEAIELVAIARNVAASRSVSRGTRASSAATRSRAGPSRSSPGWS